MNDTLGGGTPDNDGRFLKDLCNSLEKYKQHNNSQQQQQQLSPEEEGGDPNQSTTTEATTIKSTISEEPFCVVASFVNPHDVYVAQHGPAKGYTHDDLHKVKVPLPSNYTEDTDKNGKPRAHGQMSSRYVPFECTHQEYVNFYAYLHTLVDAQIGTLLDKVDDLGFTDSTLILRTADHGEQGLSHSLVEKFFNCYQESLRIPFVVSNPIAFPEPQSTDALSSHLDILPTLAGLLGLQQHNNTEATKTLQGTNLSPVLDNPHLTTTTTTIKTGSGDAPNTKEETIPGIQKSIHFTYDDISFPGAPSTIRCLHKGTLKYAVYFTPNGRDTDWELYDLTKDPLENINLAGKPEYRELQKSLERELYETMVEMETLPTAFRWPPKPTRYSQGFDHPPGDELKAPPRRNPRKQEEEDNDDDPIQYYKFSDEGECVCISLGMENIGAQCSKKDVELVIDKKSGSLILVLQNFLPEPISLSFGKPQAEITDVNYSLSENELTLTMTKKDPGIEWQSFH